MTLLCVNTVQETWNSEFSLSSRQSRKYMCIRVIVKKILSNTSLTLGEPHKPKHTLSTRLPSMIPCVREKYVCGKNHNSEPRIHLTGNYKFSESSKLSLWPFLKCFTYTNEKSRDLEFSQLTDNE